MVRCTVRHGEAVFGVKIKGVGRHSTLGIHFLFGFQETHFYESPGLPRASAGLIFAGPARGAPWPRIHQRVRDARRSRPVRGGAGRAAGRGARCGAELPARGERRPPQRGHVDPGAPRGWPQRAHQQPSLAPSKEPLAGRAEGASADRVGALSLILWPRGLSIWDARAFTQ